MRKVTRIGSIINAGDYIAWLHPVIMEPNPILVAKTGDTE